MKYSYIKRDAKETQDSGLYPGDEHDVKKYWMRVATKSNKYEAVYLRIMKEKKKMLETFLR